MSGVFSSFEGFDPRDIDPKDVKKSFESVLRWIRAIREWFRSEPDFKILIAGPGGTGKSTLAKVLTGEVEFLTEGFRNYVASFNPEEATSNAGNERQSIHVLPGQAHRHHLWKPYLERLKNGKYGGVILMGSFGYHSIDEEAVVRRCEEYGEKTAKTRFLKHFLPDQRQLELDVARMVMPYVVGATREKLWLLTVVSKQDLWANKRKDVAGFYSGDFDDLVQSFLRNETTAQIRSEIVYTSLIIQNLRVGDSEVLCRNLSGYDHFEYFASQCRLFGALDQLRHW